MAKKRYILLFVYPYELKDVDERRGLLLRSFDGERLYNGARLSVERVTDENLQPGHHSESSPARGVAA